MRQLVAYEWPGNIRQLSNTIERAILMEDQMVIRKSSISLPEIENLTPRKAPPTGLKLSEKDEKELIANALEEKTLPVYGDGKNVRDWLYVLDHCRAVDLVMRDGVPGEVYNIGGGNEMRNLDLVEMLIDRLGKSRDLIRFVKDRPGHDRRYAIDATKIQECTVVGQVLYDTLDRIPFLQLLEQLLPFRRVFFLNDRAA